MLRIREIATATLFRFLPAVAVGTVAYIALPPSHIADLPIGYWLVVAKVLVEQSIGFGMTLLLYRRRLGPDAAVNGTRTVLVGALGTALLALCGTFAGFIPYSASWVVFTLTGAVAAAVMYWPWLSRPVERQLAARNVIEIDALSAPGQSHVRVGAGATPETRPR